MGRRADLLRHIVLAAILAVALGAVSWPGPMWIGERIEPRVFGLPPGLFWNTAWIVVVFVAMAFYELTGERE